MKLEKTLKLTYTAMLTAMVCVATMLIRIPTMVGYTNLGDGFILLSAFLFGMLRSASISMSLTSQVTTEMISVLQGFIVMLVASPDVWNVLGHLWQRLKSCVGRGRKQEGAAE